MLRTLSRVGVPVPRPIEATDRATLMSYLGDEDAAAPQLHRHRARDADGAHDLLDQCLRAIERMLFHDVVHGDLSPFNVLVWEGLDPVIDLPQAVDPKKNRHAEPLLGARREAHHRALRAAGRRPRRRGVRRAPLDRVDVRRSDPEELRTGIEVEPDAVTLSPDWARRILSRPCRAAYRDRGDARRRGSTASPPTGRQALSRALRDSLGPSARGIKRLGGREEDNAGDGFFATFPQPDQGIRFATTLADEVRAFGTEVRRHPHRAD